MLKLLYADNIGKNMAFIPFTEVYYKMGKPFKRKFNFILKELN
jgi:hypothetical protein